MENETAFYKRVTTGQRIVGRLFPGRHVEAVFPEWAGRGDVVHQDTTICLSLIDRLRVLVSGRIAVRGRVTCEELVGRTAASAVSYVEPPQWMAPKS